MGGMRVGVRERSVLLWSSLWWGHGAVIGKKKGRGG